MKRTLLLLWFLPLAAAALAGQAPASLPAIAPRVTELGTISDTTPGYSLSPQYASLSPRGNLVAYNTYRELRLWNAATKSSSVLLTGDFGSVGWSPAGDAIAFARSDEQGNQVFIWSLRLDPTTGKPAGPAQRVSLSASEWKTPQFSPDSKLIAFARHDADGRPPRTSLAVVTAGGGPERILASGRGIQNIRWAKDGSAISFVMYADSGRAKPQLHRVPLQGGAPKLVFDATGAQNAPVVTTDSRLLLYAPWTAERRAVTLADLAGKPQGLLTFEPNVDFTETSGAYRIVAVRDRTPRALRITNLADGTSRELLGEKLEAGPPTWFPDGRRLAAHAWYDGRPALVTMNPDGSGLRKYPLTVVPYRERILFGWNNADLRISPDGRWASYIGGDRESLELVDLSSGSTRTLARSRITVSTPVWRQDSQSIRYILDGGTSVANTTRAVHEVTLDGTDKVIRPLPFSEFPGGAVPLLDENTVVAFNGANYTFVPLDGSTPRVVLPTPGWGGQLSPDRRILALRHGPVDWRNPKSTRRIILANLADMSRREIELPFNEVVNALMQFDPDGKHLFISGRDTPSDPVSFWSVPLDGSAPKVVGKAETGQPSIFAVSPDAKYLAYTVGRPLQYDFLLLDYTAGIAALPAGTRNP